MEPPELGQVGERTMTVHPNSQLAAATHDRNKARSDRRLICQFIADSGADGRTDEDIERAFVASGLIHSNAARIRRMELQRKRRDDGYTGHGFITSNLGEMGKSACGKQITKYHITDKGLSALGMTLDHFHVVLKENEE
jgi:hypothetical protein